MRWLSLLIGLILLTPVLADSIVLKDGSRLEGNIKKTDTGWQITATDGKVTNVPAANVKSIELGSRGNDSQSSNAALASLRRSVDALTDLSRIIERYEQFIANSKDPSVAEEAKKDLATWQDRRARGLVRQGSAWVTPEEAARLREQALVAASQVRDLLRQGQVAEAESAIQQALNADSTNPAVLYLRGVLFYRQDKIVEARKAFEAVNGSVPNHAPTLNNLAVILSRQNASGGALNFYDQAMQAQPVNKFILDNVAEALGTLDDAQRKGQAVQRVIRRFTEQDATLQKQLAAQGLFRWGSTWVDQKQLDALKAAEKEIRDRLAALEKEFEDNKRRVQDIDSEIASNEQAMRELEARSIWRDPDGKLHYSQLPASYYEYKRNNDRLRNEQNALRARFDQLRATAKATQQQLPTPKYTGVMQIVGVEGTPLLPPPDAPATSSAQGQ